LLFNGEHIPDGVSVYKSDSHGDSLCVQVPSEYSTKKKECEFSIDEYACTDMDVISSNYKKDNGREHPHDQEHRYGNFVVEEKDDSCKNEKG
jgi:hypothetical protein